MDSAAVESNFADDELEELVKENELMLAELTTLRQRVVYLEKENDNKTQTLQDLRDYCDSLRQRIESDEKGSASGKKRSVRRQEADVGENDVDGGYDDDPRHMDYDELYDVYLQLMDENKILKETVETEVSKVSSAPITGAATVEAQFAVNRLERLAAEIKRFAGSQSLTVASLQRCAVAPSTPRDRIKQEAEQNLNTLKKLTEGFKRLTAPNQPSSSQGSVTPRPGGSGGQTGGSDEDEVMTLVKKMVGDTMQSSSSALEKTLTSLLLCVGGNGSSAGGSGSSGATMSAVGSSGGAGGATTAQPKSAFSLFGRKT